MKKVLPIAICSSLSILAVLPAYAGGPIDGKVYGKLNLGLYSVDNGTDDVWEVNSAASRLGFKGKTELSEGLNVIYKVEYEISADEGDFADDELKARNMFAGLSGNFGSMIIGRNDTPFKLAQGKIDQFNDLPGGDIKNLVRGENRIDDIVMYKTPDFNGFTVTGLIQPGEGRTNGDGETEDGVSDSTSISVNYKSDALTVAVAFDDNVKAYDAARIVAMYKTGPFGIGGLWQESEASVGSNTEAKDGFILSAFYKIGDFKLKAQLGESDEKSEGRTQSALGADYKLGKQTKTFVYLSSLEDDADYQEDVFGLGLEHKF